MPSIEKTFSKSIAYNHPQPRRLPRRLMGSGGFTAIEMVTVVAIIAILVAAIGISLSAVAPRNIESQARKLVSVLSWARDMAIATHTDYYIEFDTVNKRYFIRETNSTGSLIEEKPIYVDSISLTRSGISVSNFTFRYPLGITTQAAPTIIDIKYGGERARITVFSNTGYIKWEKI